MKGPDPMVSPHRPTQAKLTHVLSFCSQFCTLLEYPLVFSVHPSGASWSRLSLAAEFASADSPVGLWGPPAWARAGHPWASRPGLPSGAESLLRVAPHPLLLLYPLWSWASFPKRAETADHPLPLMLAWVGAGGGPQFFVMIITHSVASSPFYR